MNTQLFIALDDLSEDEEKTLQTVKKLTENTQKQIGFKINLDYALKKGLDYAVESVQFHCPGSPIFVDLKMFNGSRTMANIAERLVALEVDYFNIHALADKEIKKAKKITRGSKTRILGVTVLTHFDDDYCNTYFKNSQKNTVATLASRAIEFGCDGVIIPGTALDAISNLKTIKVVPGIRPHWFKDDRHSQEITPKKAREKGADIIVCGSPIIKSENPVYAMKRILEEIS